MNSKAINKNDTIYRQVRKRAAEFNEKFKSIEGASEAIGVSKDQLSNYETGAYKQLPADSVIRMAEVYKAPELMNYYCCHECAIGKLTMAPIELCEIERLTLQILSVLNETNIERIKNSLIDITADGEITKDEIPRLNEIIETLDQISVKSLTLKLWAKKYLILLLGGVTNESSLAF